MSGMTDPLSTVRWRTRSPQHDTRGLLSAFLLLYISGCSSPARTDIASTAPATNSDKPIPNTAYVTIPVDDTATEWEFVPWLRPGGTHVEKDANGDDRIFDSPACRATLVRYRRILRVRLKVIAQNIANVDTTRDAQGAKNPYRRQFVVADAGGTIEIRQDPSPFVTRYMPASPDADNGGFVQFPNVDPAIEYANAAETSNLYRLVTRILTRFDPSFIGADDR